MRGVRVGLLVALLAGCASLDQFELDLSAQATVPGNSARFLSPHGFPSGADVAKRIENQGVRPEDVKTARLTEGTISLVGPPEGAIPEMERFELFVEADELPKVRVASAPKTAFGNAPTRVVLELDAVELRPYLTASGMNISPEVEIDPAKRALYDVTLSIDLRLFVDLTLID